MTVAVRFAAWLAVLAIPLTAHAQVTAAPAPAGPAWTLERAVSVALAQHPLIDAGAARVAAAQGARASLRALPNPFVSLSTENTDFPWQSPIPGLDRELSTSITWPLEPLFQRGPRLLQATEEVRAAEAAAAVTRRQVVDGVVRAFYRVAQAQALLDEATQNRSRLEQLADYNRARVAEGVTAEGELLRIEIELDQAATSVVVADVELTRSRADLRPYLEGAASPSALAGLRVSVPEQAPDRRAVLPDVGTVLDRARAAHPELVAGRARVAAATAATDYARRLRLPQLGATFGSKRFSGTTSMIAGLSFTVPVFNLNRGAISRATSERVAAEDEVRWTERMIAAGVEGAHRAATQLTGQLATLGQSFLGRAEEVHRLTLGAYQEGGATLLQVLDATRMLADARLTYFRTLLAQRLSLVELALATGAEPEDVLQFFHTWSGTTPATPPPGDQP